MNSYFSSLSTHVTRRSYEADGLTVRDYLNSLPSGGDGVLTEEEVRSVKERKMRAKTLHHLLLCGSQTSDAAKTPSCVSSLHSSQSKALTTMTRAVIKLHAANVIHGDLTTSNFLLRKEDGEVVAIDFGLSQVTLGNQQSKKRKAGADPSSGGGGGNGNKLEMYAVDLYVLMRALETSHRNGAAMAMKVQQVYKEESREGDRTVHKVAEVRARGRKRECFG